MPKSISRISKLLVDRNGTSPAQALERRRAFGVSLNIGDDVAASRSLQLAALTAARLATRCFPGAVSILGGAGLDAPCLVAAGGSGTFGAALQRAIGRRARRSVDAPHAMLFGDANAGGAAATRVTFDGWIGLAGPAGLLSRKTEREYCSLAPVLAAASAVSEAFLRFANVDLRAGRRVVGLSLWRPDLDVADDEAVGPRVEALPKEAWLLGLGHLGNAYLWGLATLPYAEPSQTFFYLLDFDKVEDTNVETGVLFTARDVGELKTRTCAVWLQQAGFVNTRLIERRFDEHFRRGAKEPALALSGFDNNEARQALVSANFGRVVDSGLGGKDSNFDAISLRIWPNARAANDLWPVASAEERKAAEIAVERDAAANPGYRGFKENGGCGLVEFAGKSIAVPFVGAVASTMVLADVLRLLNDGRAIESAKLRLGSLGRIDAQWCDYSANDLASVGYLRAAIGAGQLSSL